MVRTLKPKFITKGIADYIYMHFKMKELPDNQGYEIIDSNKEVI
jgi:hypothetical protein